MNTVRMILCGNVEDSRMNQVKSRSSISGFVSTEEEKIKNKLKNCKIKILKNFIWNTLLH